MYWFNIQHHDFDLVMMLTIRSKNRQRRALGFIYYSTAAVEKAEKKQYQEQLTERLITEGKL